VKVPPDVQEFLNRHRDDNVSHDIAKVMSHFSDKYLNSGITKGKLEQFTGPMIDRITSFETVITDFIPAGDKTYLTGFATPTLAQSPLLTPRSSRERRVEVVRQSEERRP